MALIIDLKPEERVIVGNSIITNDKQRTRLRIDGDAPILREKDTITPDEATTPSKKLYMVIQTMYLDHADRALNHLDDYFVHFSTLISLAPHIHGFLNQASALILQGYYYKALKHVQDLITAQDNGHEPPAPQENNEQSPHNMMEAQLISQSADQLQELLEHWDTLPQNERDNTLNYNRKLWMAFMDGVGSPHEGQAFNISTNIVHLYNFIHRRSDDIIKNGTKDKIKTLIDLNRETAMAM